MCSIEQNEEKEEASEPNEFEEDMLEQLQLQLNQLRRGRQFPNRYKTWNNQSNRRENQPSRNASKDFNSPSAQNSKGKLCINCTHYSGKLIYHTKAAYGVGDECEYDASGNKKNGFKSRVATIERETDEDDAALRSYYEERLAAIANMQSEE